MRKFLTLCLISIISLSPMFVENLKLKYNQPATEWVEALPLGNSRLGVMVYGDPVHERLQLNEDADYLSPLQHTVSCKNNKLILSAQGNKYEGIPGKTYSFERTSIPSRTNNQ